MKKKISLLTLYKVAFLAIILAILILSYAGNLFAEEKKLEKVLVGSSPVLTSVGFFIAKEKGYFAEQGIDADIRIFQSSTREILPLLATNKLDVGGGGLDAGFYNAVNEGIGIKLVADKGHNPDPGYQSIVISKKLYPGRLGKEDLKGKSFAIPMKGYPQEIFIELFLKMYDLTLDDIELYTMSYPNINAALASGSLFGASQLEPFLSVAIRDGIAVEIIGGGELYADQQGGAVFYSEGFIKNRKETAKRFMIAYVKGLRYYNDYLKGRVDKKEFFEILKKYTSIDDFELLKRMKSPAGLNPNGYLNIDSIKKDLQWYYEKEYIKKIPAMAEIIDNEFVEETVKLIGEYK